MNDKDEEIPPHMDEVVMASNAIIATFNQHCNLIGLPLISAAVSARSDKESVTFHAHIKAGREISDADLAALAPLTVQWAQTPVGDDNTAPNPKDRMTLSVSDKDRTILAVVAIMYKPTTKEGTPHAT